MLLACQYYWTLSLLSVTDTKGVSKMRAHLKMLCNDMYTYKRKADYQGGSPDCRLWKADIEDIEYIIAQCSIFSKVRERILNQIEEICNESESPGNFDEIRKTAKHLTQFTLDCSSLNLPSRFNTDDRNIQKVFTLSTLQGLLCLCEEERSWKVEEYYTTINFLNHN